MSAAAIGEVRALPDLLRGQIRPLLPPRAFLQRDRGDALYVTNAPRFGDAERLTGRLRALGFVCGDDGSRLRLSPGSALLTELELRCPDPPDFLCETLLRFRGQPPSAESLALFSRGIQLLERADPGKAAGYLRRARQLAAVSLRSHTGGAYACALIACALQNERSV